MAAPAGSALTFAQGTVEGEAVRMIAGEVNGEGVLFAEYYQGAALRFAVPYERVFVDGQETTVRALTGLVLQPRLTANGFAFAALAGAETLQCTALIYGDADVTCTRDGSWVPPGAPACAAAFGSNDERFQCNGLREVFQNPVIAHDDLLTTCSASFRYESNRVACLRYGYNAPATFRDGLAACTDAYRDEAERNYCMFYSFAPAEVADRPTPGMIRACDQKFVDDKATTDCVFLALTGVKQVHPHPKVTLPSEQLTEPLALLTSSATPLSGGPLVTVTGTRDELALRATGGMIGTEPVLWIDNYDAAGTFKYTNPIDRVVVKGHIRALRELTALDHVAMRGHTLTFHAVLAGKSRQCTAESPNTFARCR